MKRTTGLVLAIIMLAATCPGLAATPAGEKTGVDVNIGLGFTKGIDAEKALGTNIDQSAGATLRFGATYRLPLMENFYLNPTFNIGFFKSEIDFGGAQATIGGQVVNLEKFEWNTTQINFGVHPIYYFMPPTAKFRPYGGLGLKLNINSFGDIDVTARQGTGTLDGPDGKTSLALGPMAGFDYMIKPNMSIPFWLQYDLLFAEDMTGVFMVMTGTTFYF